MALFFARDKKKDTTVCSRLLFCLLFCDTAVVDSSQVSTSGMENQRNNKVRYFIPTISGIITSLMSASRLTHPKISKRCFAFKHDADCVYHSHYFKPQTAYTGKKAKCACVTLFKPAKSTAISDGQHSSGGKFKIL